MLVVAFSVVLVITVMHYKCIPALFGGLSVFKKLHAMVNLILVRLD